MVPIPLARFIQGSKTSSPYFKKENHVAENIEEITISYEDEDGRLLTKELDKEVLTKGSWTTILFLYQDMNKQTEEYGPPKMRIGRYQKRGGRFQLQSKFNISSAKQARQIRDILDKWVEEIEG